MKPFAWTLALTHSDADGGDVQTFYAASDGMEELAPDGTQYVPCLDPTDASTTHVETAVDGRTVRKLTESSSGTKTVILRRFGVGSGGIDRLAPLVGRLILGRQATLACSQGTGGDGTVYTVSSPKILAKGRVAAPVVKDTMHWEIPIRASSRLFQRILPTKTLQGYPNGLYFDGINDFVEVASYTTMPTEVTLGAAVICYRAWDVGASDTQTIWATRALEFGMKQTSGYKVSLFINYTTDAGGTQQEIVGPEFLPNERKYYLSVRVDTSPAGGGVEARFGIDAEYSDSSHATNFHSLTEKWQMGRYRTDTATTLGAIAAGFVLFSAQLTDAEMTELVFNRATGEESNLELFFPGVVNGALLLDYTVANTATPRDGTITTAAATTFFEGDESMIGVKPPLFYQGRVQPTLPVDEPNLVYRASGEHIERLSAVLLNGSAMTVVPTNSLKEFHLATAGVGEAVTSSWGGGIAKFEAIPDALQVACDVSGVSGWPYSLALGNDHGGAYVTLPSALHTAVNSQDGFAMEIWFSWEQGATLNNATVIDSQFVSVNHVGVGNSPLRQFAVTVDATLDDVVYLFFVAPNTTTAIRVEAWDDHGDLSTRISINGVVVDEQTNVGDSLVRGTATVSLLSGAFANASSAYMGVLPLRIWDWDSTKAAASTNAHREFLFTNPPDTHTDLLGMWYRSTTDQTQLDDEVGTNHGTIVNPGTYGRWQPGLCWSNPLMATMHTLRDRGDMAESDITITDAAWDGIQHEAQSLWVEAKGVAAEPSFATVVNADGSTSTAQVFPDSGVDSNGESVASVADRAIGPGYVLLQADETAKIGLVVPATAGNSEGTITAGQVLAIKPNPGKSDFPPSRIVHRWNEIGVLQPAAGDATLARKAEMSKLVREASLPVGTNATKYDDDAFPGGRFIQSRSRYIERIYSVLDAQRLRDLWEDDRPIAEVLIAGVEGGGEPRGYFGATSGTIQTIVLADGTLWHVLLMPMTSKPNLETWKVR